MVGDFDFSALVVSEAALPAPKSSGAKDAARRDQDRRRRERQRTEIAERDGWICGLCKEPVDPSYKRPDPRTLSIDHVRPKSLGGTNARDNLRLTHWGCNHERNNSEESTIADAERTKALLIERDPQLREHADKLDSEAMAGSSRNRQRPERYRALLTRRVERYELHGY